MTDTKENKEIPLPKTEAAEEVQLTIGDISTVKTIIEIASSKGAFEAKELHVVGLTYDRITKWLLANQPPKDAEETSTAEGDEND
jgi:hypothetical protein